MGGWVGGAVAVVAVTRGGAQQVDIKKAAPGPTREREPGVIAPALAREERPIDADNYPPHGGRVVLEPGFLRGLSTKTATGRVGVAGWTAPSVPVGGQVAGWPGHIGWFPVGLPLASGGPPAAPPPPPPRTA